MNSSAKRRKIKKTVKDKDEQLLEELSRRNWIILALLVLLSLLWRSVDVTLGVLSGGLLAIIGYLWLHRSLQLTLSEASQYTARGFKFSYLVRLGALTAALFLLIALAKVHPIALSAGLSVVVINILWITLKRSF